jgi:hypothetical protein
VSGVEKYGVKSFFYLFSVFFVCASTYKLSPKISFGARFLSGKTIIDDKHESILIFSELRPRAGSYHLELGVGYGRLKEYNSKDYSYKNWDYNLVLDFRMGNRWVLPIGLTLGFQYAGAHMFGYGKSVLVLFFRPEIGWSF